MVQLQSPPPRLQEVEQMTLAPGLLLLLQLLPLLPVLSRASGEQLPGVS
jgi:hypothetical protein